MKAQKAKTKGNEGPKGQKLQNAAGLGADKICLNFIRKRTVFGNFVGGTPRGRPKMCLSRDRNGQSVPFQGQKWPKCVASGREMAKMCLSRERYGQNVLFQEAFPGTEMAKVCFPGTEMAKKRRSRDRHGQNVPFQGTNCQNVPFQGQKWPKSACQRRK